MMDLLNAVLTDSTKTLFIITIIILVLEMVSGVLKAVKSKSLDSTKFREGLLSKSGYFVQVGLVILVSMMVNMPYLLYADLIWISCSEGVSVLENLDAMGVPFPNFIREVLEKTKTTTEDTVNKQ